MVLEATMICVDNSEWMRNEDYPPSRFQAQADAVYLIAGAKTRSNPKNTVGILTMAGNRVRVLTTPTTDLGRILECMHGVELGGEVNMTVAIQIAQLALKHRQNKSQQQRIIVFAGSPVKYDKETLELIGKKLKKNSVALDIVNFGEEDDGKTEKLEANYNCCSYSGVDILEKFIPVFNSDTEASCWRGFEFGVDPNIDPELALELRVSMEEEKARLEAAAKSAAKVSLSICDFQDVFKTDALDKWNARMLKARFENPEETREAMELIVALNRSRLDAEKDELSRLGFIEVLDYESWLADDIDDPLVKDTVASCESQSECEEKKKEDKPPNDEK